MAGPVTLEYKGRIAVITIDDQKKLNALSQDGYYQLATYMREVAEHDEVFITVLTGKGILHISYKSTLTNYFQDGTFQRKLLEEFIFRPRVAKFCCMLATQRSKS